MRWVLVAGTYHESVLKSGETQCDPITVAGDGTIYIFWNYQFLKETPSAGGYTESTIQTGNLYGPGDIAVDQSGNIYIEDYRNDIFNKIYIGRILKETWNGTGYTESTLLDSGNGLYTDVYSGVAVDGIGDVYFNRNFFNSAQDTWLWDVTKLSLSSNGYSDTEVVPPGLIQEGGQLKVDDLRNLYLWDTSQIRKTDYSDPSILSFATTEVGSTSSDSPKALTTVSDGNAPLALVSPSSGSNPSVATNFTLDSKTTTCPQVAPAGPPVALAANSSCTYGINFTPTQSGTINGSLVLTDNALGSTGGTQTIPLSGTGTGGIGTGGGNAVLAIYTMAEDGTPHMTFVPLGTSPANASVSGVWVDAYKSRFIVGVAEINPSTCTLIDTGTMDEVSDLFGGQLSFGSMALTVTANSGYPCVGHQFTFATASYEWGSDTVHLQDPFTLEWRYSQGQYQGQVGETLGSNAELGHVEIGPAFPDGSGPNPSLSATVNLTNPPSTATNYAWTIIGGNGTVVFPNGQETISSTTPSITVEEPNQNGSAVNFNVKVDVTEKLNVGTDTLTYGPGTGAFSYSAKDNGDCPNVPGRAVCGEPINIGTGDVYEKVVDYQTAGQNKLSFIRSYNSLPVPNTFATTLGERWRSNYDRYLNFVSSDEIAAERADGQEITFHQSGSSWISDSDIDDTLTQSGSTWTLTDHDDTVETYTQLGSGEGLLQSITLRNGYAQTMTYNGSNQLALVMDSYNRQLTFTYSNGTVSTVTTPDGLVLTYGYNTVSNPNDRLASVSYSTSPVTEQQYQYQDSSVPYALTGIVDENGNLYESWTYDSHGRALTNQVGGVANKFTVAYDDANLTRTVTNALGEVETYTFAMLQGVPKVTQIYRASISTSPQGTETFSYDASGYLGTETDWDGNETSYVNDSHGDPTTITEGVGSSVARTTTITYDSTFIHLPDTITTPGLTTSFTYDSNGEVLTKKLTDATTQYVPYSTSGATRTWTYTWQNGLLASVQSPRTDVVEKTTYSYDSTGALTGITNPLNQVTNITNHTGGGLPLTVVDPNSVSTTLNYDPRQHLLNSTTASHETKYGYDAAEDLTSVTQPDGSGLTYSYDSAHRLTGMKDLLGQSISYTLDALGDPTATDISNSSNTVTSQHSNSYDVLGRMQKDFGAASQTSSFTHDPVGNMVSATDQASNLTRRVFDALNRLDKITDPAGGVTTTSYDAHDRPVSVTSPTGGTTAYVYDGFGDLIQESSPNTGTTVYYYDSTGNLTKRVAATGAVTQYTYDALDRVLTMTYPSDSTENVAYTYDQGGHGDGIGRLTSVTDAAGTLSRSYDQFGNLLTDVRTTSTANLATAYTYDAANRIASITYPSGTLVSYTRDTMGRITAVTAKPSGGTSTPVVSTIAYEPFGSYSALTYGNGVAEARGFDEDYRLTALTDTGSSALQNVSYAYYPTNNVHTITDAVNAGNSQSFSYDNLQRLSSASGGYGSYGYTYDKDGNRVSQTQGTGTTSYGYGAASDLLATQSVGGVQTQAIGYTADGRMASFSPGIQSPGGQYITSLSYNQDARLASVNAAGGALAGYTYDGFGQRVIKTLSGTAGNIYQYGQDGMLLEETNASGVAQADYIYLNGRPVAVLNGSTLYFLHDDHLGTPQLATDSSQAIAWQATYQPFGQASVSGTITQNLRFPGQYFDVESGWNHNGFRDYIPDLGRYAEPDPLGMQGSARFFSQTVGRFFSADPLGINTGLGFYDYVADNPVNLTDPTGASPCVDINQLTHWLDSNATSHYIKGVNGHCAANVRKGFEAGGLNTTGRPGDAKNYGPFLLNHGFSEVPQTGYQPQAGDTVVFQNYPGGSQAGHIEVWDGTRWVSDFMQSTNIYPGAGYRANQAQYMIYRPNPCN